MKKLSCLFFICFILLIEATEAQKRFTISGYVSSAATGERLMDANIVLLQNPRLGTSTNSYGFYSITLDQGQYSLVSSFVGYKKDTLQFRLEKDITVHFSLKDENELAEIKINNSIPIEQRNDISRISIPVKELAKIPSLMGEKDIFKAIQLLPGVQTGNDGGNGLFVRGGGPDQNLILLDGMPVYNVSHLFGFFSVFTPEAIQSIDLYKGGFPARFGGRLSSVLDIRMKEGNLKETKGSVAVGLLSSKFHLEGPLKKDKSSFIISARRTYLDILLKPILNYKFSDKNSKGTGGYFFQDFTAKLNNIIDDKNRVFLSFYGGNDKYYGSFNENSKLKAPENINKTKGDIDWGNITGAFRWNSRITPKLFSNFGLSYTNFHYSLDLMNEQHFFDRQDPNNNKIEKYDFEYFSKIRDWSAKLDFDFSAPFHKIKFGADMIFHRFEPGASISKQKGNTSLSVSTRIITQGNKPVYSKEYNFYAEDEITFSDRLKANLGIRLALYEVNDHLFYSLQPRFAGRYLLGNKWSLKAGYAKMVQPLHLLVNSGAGLPTDLWVPATKRVRQEYSNQYTLGVAKSIKEEYEFSTEIYYKTMDNVIAYKDGANFINTNTGWEDNVEIGKGVAYGSEFFLQKKSGKTTGWISYTLAFNNRSFANIDNGKSFPSEHDRRHDIKVVAIHDFSKRIKASASWVYASGNVITLPTSKYDMPYNGITYPFGMALFSATNNQMVEYIPTRNNFRMRAYHRLDLNVDFIKEKKRGTRTWSLGVYNAYSRQNPYFYYYKKEENGDFQLKQFSLFPFLPSITYLYQF